MFRVRQRFDAPGVDDVAGAVERQLTELALDEVIRPGQAVAVAAGSRGIASIATILRAVVDHIRRLGAAPFLVPAMGSHGGGTADGQRAILESYGINERSCGCPIRASMATVVIGQSAEGFPIHLDQHAYAADHVVVCNRVKTHTQFSGRVESGLSKMLLIGLGKHVGARIYHRAIQDYSFDRILRSVTAVVTAHCSVIGVGIVENAYGRTARVAAAMGPRLAELDEELLVQSKRWAARLPFDRADVLLIDEIGKNISGTGFDVSVAGRKYLDHEPAPDEYPKVRIVALRNLTDLSGGNAEGMGLAEFCRTRLIDQADLHITRINALTSGHYTGAMLPIDFETDTELLQVVLTEIGLTEPPDARLIWIHNTLDLGEVECAAAFWDEARSRDDLEVLTDPRPLPFDAAGNLPDDVATPSPAAGHR